MASFHSVTSTVWKGQAAIVCQLCKNDSKLKWKCLECGLMICQRCQDEVHSKFALSKEHTIIDIKNFNKPVYKHQEEENPDFTQLKCMQHNGQNCCLFCIRCGELVCQICVSNTHDKHDMTDINEGYKTLVDKIKQLQKDIDDRLIALSKGQEELRKIKFLEQSNYNKSKEGILHYKKSLIESIEKHCDKLLSDLDQKWDEIAYSIQKADKESRENQKTLLQQNNNVKEVLQSNDAMKIFSSCNLPKSIKTKIETVNTRTLHGYGFKFVPGDSSKITLLHGKLQKVTNQYNTEIKVLKKLNTDFYRTSNLIACADGKFWINDGIKNLIHQVFPERNSMEVASTFKLAINDMALTPTGDVLLCVRGLSIVKVIPSGTEEVKDSPYNVSSLRPLAIHVTRDKKVIIGTRNIGPWFPSTGPRQVMVFNPSGQMDKVFEYDCDNKPLFTLPVRVTSTSHNELCIVDWLSKDKGRVIVLDYEGTIINIYSGHPDVNTYDTPFKPFNIVTTQSDNFVISDYKNHTLHILSINGEILTYYNTKALRIELPSALSFDHAGLLYIGCDTYEDSDENAKIFKIDNFVW